MPTFVIILLDAVIIWFFWGNVIARALMTKRQKLRNDLKRVARHYRNLRLRDSDILTAAQVSSLALAEKEVLSVRDSADAGAMEECLKKHGEGKSGHALPPGKKCAWLGDILEALVVSLAVAFSIRSLLIQPFKIPTGSMQPTLYGIHFEENELISERSALRKFLCFANFGERSISVKAPSECLIPVSKGSFIPRKSFPFFPNSAIVAYDMVGHAELLPVSSDVASLMSAFRQKYEGDMENALALGGGNDRVRITGNRGIALHFNAGEDIMSGVMVSGDHLFVNRLGLCFREPRRGDVMVFSTKGITYNGGALGGSFYIKRLIGLPGDTLKIEDSHVWVKPAGETAFHPLSSADHPAFEKIYSGKNGYRGHLVRGEFLGVEGEEFIVPEGEYFMLGDNTANSLDSRYWGTVPRSNLIGPACFVWWPFSKHFARVDR